MSEPSDDDRDAAAELAVHGPDAELEVAVGDVVQVDPKAGGAVFGRAFLIVDKVRPFGFTGRILIPGRGDAVYQVERRYAHRVGVAKWRRPI